MSDRLEALRKSFLAMSPEELRAKMRQVREDRKIKKESPKSKVRKAKAQNTALTKTQKLLAALSPKEREALMKELGE